MSTKEEPKLFTSLWHNLKRALTSTPDIDNNVPATPTSSLLDSLNTSNFSNNTDGESVLISEIQSNKTLKRQRLNIAVDQIGLSEENSFMETMKSLLSCSICLEVNNYSNQCPNGHLICITCSGRLQQSPGDLNCPVCRVSLKQGLHRSLLAEQLTSELPASCRHCEIVMPVKLVKKHETETCQKRIVACRFKLYGCAWFGVEENRREHEEKCSVSGETVGELHKIVSENIDKDFNLLQVPLQLWRNIVTKIRCQAVGSRLLIRQIALNKSGGDNANHLVFKSAMIRVPFSCCSMHGFYVDLTVLKNNSETEGEKLQYLVKSENRTKITLNYFIAGLKVDESINLEVQDSLHQHQFESTHKESLVQEIKLVSLDCDKEIPKLSDFESLFVELCFISERERSERSHGIMNPNEEDETTGFLSTGGSDSNVVFTLFSPTTSSSRSMNTSNTIITGNDDQNAVNEVEPSHEEDIVITVTENVDSGDDVSVENREHFETRNNHSYVAVPSIFLNPTAPIYAYAPFQIENFQNGTFQQGERLAPDNQSLISEQEVERLQTGNSSVAVRQGQSTIMQDNRFFGEPIRMSLYYPPQTIVTPFLSSSVNSITARPSFASRNIPVRPNFNSSQVFTRQSEFFANSDIESGLTSDIQSLVVDPSVVESRTDNNIENDQNLTFEHNNHFTFPSIPNESVSLEDSILQAEEDDEV